MTVHRIGDRFAAWLRVEAAADRYASYGALGLAALATAAAILLV